MQAITPLYTEFTRLRSEQNPCLSGLVEHMEHVSVMAGTSITLLEYTANARAPSSQTQLGKNELPELFRDTRVQVVGRVLLIENIQPDIINSLGQLLDLDPIFFAEHITTDSQDIEKAPLPPSLAFCPSQIAKRDHLHIHYQQIVDLGNTTEFKNSKYLLYTDSNVPRNTRRLPHLSGRQLALARGCCSILLKRLDKIWYSKLSLRNNSLFTTQSLTIIAIILVDPPVKTVVELVKPGEKKFYPARPLHRGFEDFEKPAAFSYYAKHSTIEIWDKSSMLQSLLHYFRNNPPGFTAAEPKILSFGYYPIRIILAEWVLYAQLVSRYHKYYEYSLQDSYERLHESDIIDLQRWRRRNAQSQYKLGLLSEFISYWLAAEAEANKQPWEMLLTDIAYVRSKLRDYNHSMEQTVPVATAMVQLLDARQSARQAANITMLTYITLVFAPLSWVSGLFSMANSYFPGQENFWVYFATALPILIVVLLISFIPLKRSGEAPGSLLKNLPSVLRTKFRTGTAGEGVQMVV